MSSGHFPEYDDSDEDDNPSCPGCSSAEGLQVPWLQCPSAPKVATWEAMSIRYDGYIRRARVLVAQLRESTTAQFAAERRLLEHLIEQRAGQ